jgi:putative transposase
MEDRIRELERQLGRKTLEVEILKEAVDRSRVKKPTLLVKSPLKDGFPMTGVAETLGVSRSNLHDRLSGRTKPRRRYHKAQDAAVLALITALVAGRPSYGYRRITAILNRKMRAEGLAPVNHKRVYCIIRPTTCCWRGNTPSGLITPMMARSSSCAQT